MKTFLILASLVAVAVAEAGYDYSNPNPNIQPPGPQYGVPNEDQNEYTPKVYRHIYVHSAPDEEPETQTRTIRVPGGGNKHVNIIFVKTPSQSFNQETEVILPEQDQQKSLVYVLLKKNEAKSNVRIRGPAPTQPSKPEVYFIRYKNGENGKPSAPAPEYGVPNDSNSISAPSSEIQAPVPVAARSTSSNY